MTFSHSGSLLFHLRHPNSKKISRVFCEILAPKNSLRKTESALVPPLARILGGQNTKENVLSFLEEIGRAQIRKARNIFLWCPPRLCEAVAGLIHSFSFRSKKVRAKCIITAPERKSQRVAVRLRRLSEFSRGDFLAACGGEMRSD